jgi:hypothetical protein
MATYNSATTRPRTLGFWSLALGILGIVFWWWVPFGAVLSLAGLLTGFIGWVVRGIGTRVPGVVAAGIVVSVVALALDIVLAANGLGTIRLTSFQ